MSGVWSEANLFILKAGVNIHELPRTVRNVQNFDYSEGLSHLCEYMKNILPKSVKPVEEIINFDTSEYSISIITGKQATVDDIREAVQLYVLVYNRADKVILTISVIAKFSII